MRRVFDGQSVASVARELGVSENLLHNWKKTIKAGSTPAENELIELKKKLRIVEMENDILKKRPLSSAEAGRKIRVH